MRLLLRSSQIPNLYMGIHNNKVILVPEASAGMFKLQGVDVTATCPVDARFRMVRKSSNGTDEYDVEILEIHPNSNAKSHNSSSPSWVRAVVAQFEQSCTQPEKQTPE